MGIVESLRDTFYGVTLRMPDAFEVHASEALTANLLDRAHATAWHLFFFRNRTLDLSPESEASLRRDVEQHAEFLLESMVLKERADSGIEGEAPKPVRSPLISCDYVTVDGAPALSVLHRMIQRPGLEIVMGHLLVPVSAGLFEVRWLVHSKMTGIRESILLAKALGTSEPKTTSAGMAGNVELGLVQADAGDDKSPDEIEALMRSINYDDPKYDAEFPDHVLSVARRAERWIREEAGVRIHEAGAHVPRGEIVLQELACAIVPPPRFKLEAVTRAIATLHRVSLAGNDGVQLLFIEHPRKPDDAKQSLEQSARNALVQCGMLPSSVSARSSSAPIAGLVVADGARGTERMRVVVAGVMRERHMCQMTLLTTPSHPVESIEEELMAVAKTYRAVSRPWWKLW